MFQGQAKTEVQEFKYSYKWTVENFSRLFRHVEHWSPPFSFDEASWTFRLYANNDSMSVDIYRSHPYSSPILMKSQICALDSSGKVIHEQSKESSGAKKIFELAVMPMKCLNEVASANKDILDIAIHIALYRTITSPIKAMPSEEYTMDEEKFECHHLLTSYDSKLPTDVALIVKGEKIHVHKAILSAMSPVFADMFQGEMAKSSEYVIHIENIKLITMKELVNFMYSRVKLDYEFDTAMDIYKAADKFRVMKLRETCGQIILLNLDEKNAIQLLKMADKCKDDILKKALMEFINSNFKSCVNADWWRPFASEKSKLFKELKNFLNK